MTFNETTVYPECVVTRRSSPSFQIKHWAIGDGKAAMKNAIDKQTIWQLLRSLQSDDQEVPSMIGFTSISNTWRPSWIFDQHEFQLGPTRHQGGSVCEVSGL